MGSSASSVRDRSGSRERAPVADEGFAGRLRSVRDKVRARPGGRLLWRIGVTVLGAGLVALGVVLLPLPGPGWLIIFAGLGVLSTEYEWAARLLHYARRKVAQWTDWVRRQPRAVQLGLGVGGLLLVAAVVLGYLWVRGSL